MKPPFVWTNPGIFGGSTFLGRLRLLDVHFDPVVREPNPGWRWCPQVMSVGAKFPLDISIHLQRGEKQIANVVNMTTTFFVDMGDVLT